MSLLHGPSESEYQSSLDRPGYDPSNRLLLRHGDELVGHIRLTRRQYRLGRSWLPTCELSELAILPEYAGRAQIQRLLDSAAQQAIEEGALILTSRARRVDEFPDPRWVSCGDATCWEAPPRDVLARCADELREVDTQAIHVRPWRYIEQQALSELYEANAEHVDGAQHRDEDYWQWLLVRRGFDSILVVMSGVATEDESSTSASDHIVAYAFQRDSDIVEMMVSPDAPEASVVLVQRIAADAIERDDHQVRVFGPRNAHPLAKIMDRVLPPGENATRRLSQLVRVVDYPAFISMCWNLRLDDELPNDGRLGLRLDDAAMTLEVQDGVLRVTANKMPRSQVHARGSAVSALLLGQIDWSAADPNIEASSASAARFAERLFRPIELWRSTLDDLPSRK